MSLCIVTPGSFEWPRVSASVVVKHCWDPSPSTLRAARRLTCLKRLWPRPAAVDP